MTGLQDVVAVSAAVAAESGRKQKVVRLAEFLGRLDAPEVVPAVAYLSGEVPQGRIGIGLAMLRQTTPERAAPEPVLTVTDLDAALEAIAGISGAGSRSAREEVLSGLLRRATAAETEFIWRLLLGDLRQGALEGVMVEAVARAARVTAGAVRKAHMLGGDLPAAAVAALTGGKEALDVFRFEMFRPVLPMLAQTAEDVSAALDALGPAAFEWKIDGARIQVHRADDEVRIFTRNLIDVTDRLPDIVETVASFPAASFVLDGEAIALAPGGVPRPFQETMARFGTRVDVTAARAATPLTPFFFDCLVSGERDLLDLPGEERWAELEACVPEAFRVPRIMTDSSEAAAEFFAGAVAAGHEGVVAKSPTVRYEAGRRGSGWLKVKPVRTLDLVVLAVEWGSGRRHGWLSNLHLGARDPATGEFVMLGKTFKGLTDDMLRWQTERFLELETGRRGHVVHVRPEQVVEVAFDGVQASPRYPGGMALRFARVKGYRSDKRAEEADTVDMVRALLPGAAG